MKCFSCGQEGHGIRECDSVICRRCQGRGHIQTACPMRSRSPSTESDSSGHKRPRDGISIRCNTCKRSGHRAETCSETTCRECGRRGHMSFHCPNKDRERKCYFCKRKGHQVADCDLRAVYPQAEGLCSMCLRPGHQASDCHNEAACHQCAQPGHVSSECPESECQNCHEHGHSVVRCPTVRCFRCHESGHMASDCAEKVALNAAVAVETKAPKLSHSPPASQTPAQISMVLPTLPPVPERNRRREGRVCVIIDGPYFESCINSSLREPDYKRTLLALQHTLHFIGEVFEKNPTAFWFDMDPVALSEFVDREFSVPLRQETLQRLQRKQTLLTNEMTGGGVLGNVVPRPVGKVRHRLTLGASGYGVSWMPAGIDVALSIALVECFESRQYSQVVLLSGDGALCPAVDFCNHKRRQETSAQKNPVRVCGSSVSMDPQFGANQDLVDFLPRIFLDKEKHNEQGDTVPFPIFSAFQH